MLKHRIGRTLRTQMSLIGLGLLACCLPAVALSQDAKEGEIAIGGERLLRIRVPADGKTVKQRTDDITDRLPVILGDSQIGSADIRAIRARENIIKIMVKDHLLLTVTPEDGRANGLTTAQQAQVWLKSLRRVLPTINAKPNPTGP
jgi:hypothetical protein